MAQFLQYRGRGGAVEPEAAGPGCEGQPTAASSFCQANTLPFLACIFFCHEKRGALRTPGGRRSPQQDSPSDEAIR